MTKPITNPHVIESNSIDTSVVWSSAPEVKMFPQSKSEVNARYVVCTTQPGKASKICLFPTMSHQADPNQWYLGYSYFPGPGYRTFGTPCREGDLFLELDFITQEACKGDGGVFANFGILEFSTQEKLEDAFQNYESTFPEKIGGILFRRNVDGAWEWSRVSPKYGVNPSEGTELWWSRNDFGLNGPAELGDIYLPIDNLINYLMSHSPK